MVKIQIEDIKVFLQLNYMKNQEELRKQVQRLTNQIEVKNSQVENQIKDKSAIMLMGNTGAGKSTIANDLLGYPMKATKQDQDSKDLIIRNENSESKAPKIAMSMIDSQTSELQIFRLQDNKVLIDTPGFNETRGSQADIKNISVIKNVLRKCKSLKIILVITKKDLSQQKYIKITQLMEKLSKSLIHYNENSFILYVTMCTSQWNKERVKDKMKMILKQIQKKSQVIDQKLKNLYRFIIQSCQINLTYIPKQEGIYTLSNLSDSQRQRVLNNNEGTCCTFDLQQFKFVSSKSTSQVNGFITKVAQKNSKIQKSINKDQSNIKQIENLDLVKILNNYQVVSIYGISFLINKQTKGYLPALALTGAALFKSYSQDKLKRQDKIKVIRSAIEEKNIIIKKHESIIQTCKSMIQ